MATLISAATGDFTTAGTWKVASAVSAAENDSETNVFNMPTSGDLANFIPAATAIDAIGFKISSVITPTGTVTASLYNVTSATTVASVTINASDLRADAAGWHIFSFTPHTPNGTDTYRMKLGRSVNDSATNRISVYITTTNTFTTAARVVRTTTTAVPGANDKLIIAGEYTGQGTSTSYTVTMNETATTSYGPTVSGGPPQGVTVNDKATLSYGTSASTNYYLKMKGVLAVFPGGTLNIGTSGTSIPSTSTAVLEFDSVANVDSGLDVRGGTVNMYGATKTTWTYLTADKSATNTVLTLESTSGWAASDDIALASTSRTYTDCEKRTISTVDSATQVTVSAGLTNGHSGTSPTQAEVINLTRGVKVRGVSDSLQSYVRVRGGSTFTVRYAEFSRLGSSTTNKRGIDVQTTTGSFDMQYSVIRDFIAASSRGIYCGINATNVTFSNNVGYNIYAEQFYNDSSTGTWTVDGNVLMFSTNSYIVILNDMGGTFTNNVLIGGSGIGLRLAEVAVPISIANNTIHSCSSYGINVNTFGISTVISNTTIWRCGNRGLQIGLTSGSNLTIDGATLFGNTVTNIDLGISSYATANFRFINVKSNGDSSFATTSGIIFGGHFLNVWFENCNFGSASGIKTAHTQDIEISGAALTEIHAFNCKFSSPTEVSGQSNLFTQITSTKHDQVSGNHKTFFRYGTITSDTSIFNAATPAQTLTPNSSTNKLESGTMKFFIEGGSTKIITATINKSASYNGAQPRLILKRNPAIGVSSDVVLDTATGGTGSWLTLSGTTSSPTRDGILEVFVDCSGTAGFVTVDDWSIS